jgi:hypothetical protein
MRERQQTPQSLRRQKSNLLPGLFVDFHAYRDISRVNLPSQPKIFPSMALKDSYKSCEFENKHMLPFVDILYLDPKDNGYFVSILLNYEAEMV